VKKLCPVLYIIESMFPQKCNISPNSQAYFKSCSRQRINLLPEDRSINVLCWTVQTCRTSFTQLNSTDKIICTLLFTFIIVLNNQTVCLRLEQSSLWRVFVKCALQIWPGHCSHSQTIL